MRTVFPHFGQNWSFVILPPSYCKRGLLDATHGSRPRATESLVGRVRVLRIGLDREWRQGGVWGSFRQRTAKTRSARSISRQHRRVRGSTYWPLLVFTTYEGCP